MGQVSIKPAAKVTEEKQEATRRRLTGVVQTYLDEKAKERDYDNIFTLIGYRGDPNPKFDVEAQAAFLWRSEVWTTSYQILQDVMSGARSIPTEDELRGELPDFQWPEDAQ